MGPMNLATRVRFLKKCIVLKPPSHPYQTEGPCLTNSEKVLVWQTQRRSLFDKLRDFEYIPIVPREGADGAVASLTLHRQGEHYNGVGTVPITTVTVPMGASEMPDLSESSDKSVHTAYAVNDTVVKYDRQQLLQIGLNNTAHLNRTVRKTLFRHSIWRPNRRVTSVN